MKQTRGAMTHATSKFEVSDIEDCFNPLSANPTK